MPDTNIPPSPVRLCISGLPSLTDSMLSGGVYALIAETPPARFPILASSLDGALRQGLRCTVILPSETEADAFVKRIDSFKQFVTTDAISAGTLQLFTLQDDFAKNMFRFGAETFARDMDHFQIPADSYLIFDRADELFSLHDVSLAMEQIDILKLWFNQHRITTLLIFTRLVNSGVSTLNAMMDKLTGIVRIGGDRAGLELTFDYWQSQEGTIAAKHHSLSMLESGLYKVSTSVASSLRSEPEEAVADGEARVFYMDPDLISLAKQMPGSWQNVDTLVGMMHATRDTPNATVILSFRHDTNLRQLAEAVHTLRLNLGRRARIVVRENDASLRYQNEALLLRLGVNLIVHRDLSASRLPLLLESLSGQIFDRDVDIDFEVALASVIPSGLRGYLPPARFAREARTIVERGESLNIPCSMVVGRPSTDGSVADILAQIDMARPGDLASSDGESCYLFLNGCPESVLLKTVERVLGQALNVAFDQSRFVIRRLELLTELAALERAAGLKDLPDYSSQLVAAPHHPEALRSPKQPVFEEPPAVQDVAVRVGTRPLLPPATDKATEPLAVAPAAPVVTRPLLPPATDKATEPLAVAPAAPVVTRPLLPPATDKATEPLAVTPAAPVVTRPLLPPATDKATEPLAVARAASVAISPIIERPTYYYSIKDKESTYGKGEVPRAARARLSGETDGNRQESTSTTK